MAQAIAGGAIGALGIGDPVFAEYCIATAHGYLSESLDAAPEAGFLRFAQNDTRSRVHSKIILPGSAGFSRCSICVRLTTTLGLSLRLAQNETQRRSD